MVSVMLAVALVLATTTGIAGYGFFSQTNPGTIQIECAGVTLYKYAPYPHNEIKDGDILDFGALNVGHGPKSGTYRVCFKNTDAVDGVHVGVQLVSADAGLTMMAYDFPASDNATVPSDNVTVLQLTDSNGLCVGCTQSVEFVVVVDPMVCTSGEGNFVLKFLGDTSPW